MYILDPSTSFSLWSVRHTRGQVEDDGILSKRLHLRYQAVCHVLRGRSDAIK